MLTCSCGVVDTEPVVLAHLSAFEAAEEKLLGRHSRGIVRAGFKAEFE